MSPRIGNTLIAALVCAHAACADPTEDYLREHGLNSILEAYLEDRVENAPPAEREEASAALAELYLERMQTTDDSARAETLDKMETLLDATDSEEAYDLRIGLAVERYDAAERTAELALMGAATPEAQFAATAELSALAESFDAIGSQLERDVLYLERRARDSAADTADDHARASRQRSLAKYYAGWAYVQLALLNNDRASANRALDQFSWTLDTPGEAPSLDRLPGSLLEFEHVARAAVGVALAHHALGDDSRADDWLDRVQNSTLTPAPVRAFARNRAVLILSRRGEWTNAMRLVEAGSSAPAPPDAARILAVHALDAVRSGSPSPAAARLAAAVAIRILATDGHTGHVIDLASRFPIADLLDDGFLKLYLSARDAQAQADNAPDPARYASAAADYRRALKQPDAIRFRSLRAEATYSLATCLFHASQHDKAADTFAKAEDLASTPLERQRALWMTIVSHEQAAGGSIDPEGPIPALARRYFREHPDAEQGVALALRLRDAGAFAPDEVVPHLLGASPDDQLGRLALHAAAEILAERAASSPASRDAFFDLSANLLSVQPASPNEGARAVSLARRTLRLSLDTAPPRPEDAEHALAWLDELATASPALTTPHDSEIAFRRIQLALLRDDYDGAHTLYDRLDDTDRSRAALAILIHTERDTTLETRSSRHDARVVSYASAVLESPGHAVSPEHLAWVSDRAAAAAARLWRAGGDPAMRDLAIKLDERAIVSGTISDARARRLAGLAESAERHHLSRRVWLLLMAAARPGDDAWFEARYQSIRAESHLDRERARAAAHQFAALYPSLGPDPWRVRFASLFADLGVHQSDPAPGADAP